MAINQILQFGAGSGANVLTFDDYSALVARESGFQAGVAKSKEVNTPIRQAAFVASMIGQFTADNGDVDVLDDADVAGLQAKFRDAIEAVALGGISGAFVGMVCHFAAETAPTGWLRCNGAAVSRTTFSALFAAVGTTFGEGDGSATFNLPDLRGEFLRGLDDGRGLDSGRVLGSAQASQNLAHTHGASTASAGGHSHTGSTSSAGAHSHRGGTTNSTGGDGYYVARTSMGGTLYSYSLLMEDAGVHSHTLTINSAAAHQHGVTVSEAGGPESRPRNIALPAFIKY